MGKDLFNPHLRKFSIRKLNVGVCSVLLSTLILLGTAANAAADELPESSTQGSGLVNAEAAAPRAAETEAAAPATETAQPAVAAPAAEAQTEAAAALPVANPAAEVSAPAPASPSAAQPSSGKSESSPEAQPAAEETEAKETAQPSRRTPGYAVNPVPTPTSSAMPRPTNQGQPLPQGTGFRNTGATGVTPGSGPAGADDATATARVPKPALSESEKKDSTQLAKQITWIDFSDTASMKNVDAKGGFKVGTTFQKEISPGYVVTLTVTELKPFHSTEIYKKRVEGTASAGTYDPNATNSYLKGSSNYGKTPSSVTGKAQDKWSTIGGQGFDTKGRKTQIIVPEDAVNWGVKFKIEATYRGHKVSPTVVMADGEDANPGEFGIFTTNGQGWEYVGEWNQGPRAKGPYAVMTEQMVKDADKARAGGLLILKDKAIDWNKFLSPDTTTGGLGSQVFGPIVSASKAVPVVMTRGASEVGFYVATAGQQALMMGFLVVDGGDAPASYGQAYHTIGNRDSLTNAVINQPYLGTTPADIDMDTAHDWTLDDHKETADEGAEQLLTLNQFNNSNDLLDLNKAKNGTYKLTIKASPNGNANANIKAWVDFNQNGVFDDNEGSLVKTITAAGDHTLTFNALPALAGGLADQLGIRVRIATNANDIAKPTGTAFSGEVEDLLIRRVYPPQGDRQTGTGFQGETQTATVHFTPKGANRTDFTTNATISTQAPQVLDKNGTVLTPTDGNTYIRPEGTYVVTANGADVDVTFTPNDSFTGTADGINIRRADSNGLSTNWQSTDASNPSANDQLNTMDGRFVPTVRPVPAYTTTDLQGLEQRKTLVFNDGQPGMTPVTPDATRPATFLDASGQPVTGTSVPAMANGQQVGTYELAPSTGEVTFKPNKSFVGTPDAVVVQVQATDGQAHRARYQPTVTQVTPTAVGDTTTGKQGQVQTGQVTFTPGHASVGFPAGSTPLFDNDSTVKEIPNVGKFEIDAQGKVTFTPVKTFTGPAPAVEVHQADVNGTVAKATYQATVTAVTPTGTNAESTGKQGQTQTGTPTFTPGDAAVPLDDTKPMTFDDGQTSKTVTGQGTYTIGTDGVITFIPEKQFTGKATPVTVKRVDTNGTEVTATYTPDVTAVTPTGDDVSTTGKQGQVQTGTPVFTEGDPLVPIDDTVAATFEDGSTKKEVPNVGTFEVAPNGTVTFTPEKQYVGTPDSVTVKRVDKNGTEATANYTVTVEKVTPTATNAESTGKQGQTQTGTPTFTPGDAAVPLDDTKPMTFDDGQTSKTVTGQGTYTIGTDGVITFVPEKQFTGKATPVTVKRVDANGTEVTATYTPDVTAVTPTGDDVSTTGKQGQVQTGTPVFTEGDPLVPLDNDTPATFEDGTTKKEVPNVGTFEVAPNGTVTFTPEKQYVGSPDPVTVKRVDKNGTEVTAKYTVTVEKVTPTGTDVSTSGKQGQVQTGTPVFTEGDPLVPLDNDTPATFEDGSTKKEVPNVGTFEVAPNGTVTFTPEKQYVGTPDPVTVKRVDKNGTEVTAKYTVTVEKVTPTGTDVSTSGKQGQVQTGSPVFTEGDPLVPLDNDTPATFEDGTTKKEVPNVGTFEVAPNGIVTFTPEKQYVGTPDSVTVKRVDKNGTEVTAKYTATVEKVTPTATNAESRGKQGQTQTGKPTFKEGDPLVPLDNDTPATFDNGSTRKEVPNVGTFEVAPDGTVTFTPEKQYVGSPDPVTVKRVDKNGTEVTAKYTVTVEKVTPTATNAESRGKQGKTQTGTPTFTPGDASVPLDDTKPMTFDDGQTSKTVTGQGTYTIGTDGVITFVPEKQFTGKATPVTVKRVDINGTEVTATYTPDVTAVTPTGTDVSTTGKQGQVQTGTPVFTEGDPLVPLDNDTPATFEDGSTRKEVPNVGIFEVAPDGTVTFTPDKQYVGSPDPVTVKRVDKNGTEVTAKYTVTVEKVTPTGTDVSTTGKQGQVQTGSPVFTEGDPSVPLDNDIPATFEDGSTRKEVPNVGTFEVAPDGTVTFTPEKQYVGSPEPVTVKRVDKNGTEVTAKYTVTVEKVTPTGTDVSTIGKQGQVQTGSPVFTEGDPLVPLDNDTPATFEDGTTKKEVPNVGTFEVAPNGTVTFTPEKRYVGSPDPVTVKRVDKNGTEVTAKYTATVEKVTPTGTDVRTANIKGMTQTGSPVFEPGDPAVPLDDTVPATFDDGSTERVIPGEGRYSVSPEGLVTFVPEADFVGQGSGVTVLRKDVNGTPVTAGFLPTVTDPSTAQDTASTGAKGQPQIGSPSFEGSIDTNVAPTFEDGSTELTVPGEGHYSIDKDGQVTFTPEPDFVGTAKGVVVKRLDIYGNPVTALYQPTVIGQTRVEDVRSEGYKGQTQTGQPIFEGDVDLSVSPTFDDGSTEKVIPGEGTYTLSPDGLVTFVPEPNFIGQATGVIVIRKDRNGKTISAAYKPLVTEIPVNPVTPPTPERPVEPMPTVKPADIPVKDPELPADPTEPIFLDAKKEKAQLPNTGSKESSFTASALLAAVTGLSLFGLAKRKKSSDEE